MSFSTRLAMVITLILVLVPQHVVMEAQENLTIGWAELDTAGLNAEMSRLGILLPMTLMKATAFIDQRFVLQGEASVKALKTVNLDLEKAREAVAASRRKRDFTTLSIRDPTKRAMELRSAQRALDAQMAILDELIVSQADPPDTPPFPQFAVLKFWDGHEDGRLLPSVEDAAEVCTENKLDLLVFGKIQTVGPYLTVELVLYVAATNEEIWKTVEYTAFDDLDGLVGSLERPLATALAGRPYGRALFSVTPAIVEILVDGKTNQNHDFVFYSQGSYLATVSAAGFRTVSQRFAVIPGSDTIVQIQLVPVQTASLFVESFPSGAALYIDGAPLGVSPLELSGAAFPRILTARMSGFDDLRVVLRPGLDSGRVVLDLEPSDGLVYADRFEQAKGAFYKSLGWLILSLPVTVLSYGTFNSYQNLLGALSEAEFNSQKDSFALRFYGSQSIFWVSAAVSTSLATNSIIRLVRYIKTVR